MYPLVGYTDVSCHKSAMKNKLLLLSVFAFLFFSCSRTGSTVNPLRKDVVETVYASGKIISENEYTLFALSNGTVKEKRVKEGDAVAKDEILYVISNDAPAARLEAAQSTYENAQKNVSAESRILNDVKLTMQSAQAKFSNDSLNYFRLKNLLEHDAASKSTVDNAFTGYTISLNQKKSAEEKYYAALNELNVALHNAKSQVAGAQSDLNNYFIRSEQSGTIFQMLKEVGEAVHAGEPVSLLGETASRIIKLSVDQQDIDKLKTGQEVLLKTDVTGNKIFHAEVSRIYPMMNEIDQTFRVDAVFKDSVDSGLGGFIHSSVEANIIIQEKSHALIIPRAAMVADDSVQVKRDGKVKTVFVQTGIQTLDDVEILNGLDESAEVIIPNKK